jgi:midasin
LAQLDRFESELQTLSQGISLEADRITHDQFNAMHGAYSNLVDQLCGSHSDLIQSNSLENQIEADAKAQLPEEYRSVLEGTLKRCVGNELHRRADVDVHVSSQVWIDFALAGLSLYIPNYPQDPALRPMIERRLFNELKTTLQQKLDALRNFQSKFTGQDTSVRIRELNHEIVEMGAEPPVPPIVRPEVSELDALQGEFSNLLSVIQPLTNGTMAAKQASQDATLRSNISRIIDRLVGGYRSYEDITGPAVGFLVCLIIGLTLGAQGEEEESDIQRSLQYITRYTPFFGLHQGHARATSETLYGFWEEHLDKSHAVDLRWHALQSLVLVRNVEPSQMSGEKVRSLLHQIFSSFYTEWKQKLLHDQEQQAKDTSLYTYKGDDEDADEEDPELFPDYEKEGEDQDEDKAPTASRDHTIRFANIHAQLLVEHNDGSDALRSLLEWCSAQMVRVSGGEAHGTRHESALPAIFLALEKKSNALSESGSGRMYNFYFDANLTEAKRFIALIHRIQARYRQIRSVWPEHATLSDVLRTCDEALAFKHVEPVAKFITKAEKLYGYMHEWQRVASREFSTAPVYDELTKLLVSWRQLELTTWARLFDIEMEKCKDNAKSWFFVAYETIVAASESIEDPAAMTVHAKELLKAMEGFFGATTLGQFEQRMKLLEQFREHIAMLMQNGERFRPIHLALDNFIAYFSRLKKPVHEAIVKGRHALEKDVNNVIKLASWKDINIEALKQSAKTSHRKLSKLVRKFRAILNRPVSGLLGSGFPEETFSARDILMGVVSAAVSPNTLEICEKEVPAWETRPTRFKNLTTTVKLMCNMSCPSVDVIDGAKYIDSFITDLEASITELQKATPSVLTEENKETVQHLKTQKRKLYADTMKELRQMGVQSNLSMDVLAKQDELAIVLARLPTLTGDAGQQAKGAEYFLHKSLSIMTQVREIAKEHSGDLTGNDVARSVGYIEGLLHVVIRQRGLLSRARAGAQGLQGPAVQVGSLCSEDHDALVSLSEEQTKGARALRSDVSWLSVMLKFGAEITAAQAKLGRTNEFDVVVRGLQEWSAQFRNLASASHAQSSMPGNVWSKSSVSHVRDVEAKVSEFREIFYSWLDEYPLPRAVLKQIVPYLQAGNGSANVIAATEPEQVSLEACSQEIFGLLDLILGAMQDVEAALMNLPKSTDDATWLVKEEQSLYAAISGLHAQQIANTIQQITDKMQYLGHEQNLRAVAAMLAAVKPILDQYLASQNYLVEKFEALHLSTGKLLYRLAKSFIQVGTQGFCTPSEKSNEQSGKDDKLESGTGLGEGEGAEDISKDIEDDEDLEDLAQEQKGEREGSIEEEEDAVDMGEQEMEGEMGDVVDKEDEDKEGEEGEEDDVQSEVGSVDDLGPSAVDEKMWDEGGKEDNAKEKEGEQDVGTENQDEQVAAEDNKEKKDKKEGEEGEEEQKEQGEEEDEEMEGEEQDENVGMGETEKMDPHAKEEETLDLPDELNIDGDENDDKQDDDLGDMDMGDEEEEETEADAGAEPDTVDEEVGPEQENEEEQDKTGHTKDDEEMGEEEEGEEEGDEPVDDDVIPLPDEEAPPDEARDAQDDNAQDPNAEAGAGTEANDEAHQQQDNQASASAANREDGTEGESSEKKQETTAEDGTLGQTAQPDASGRSEETEETPETQSFKKLGDVLEKWYNQQKQIQESREKDETQVQQIDKEVDMADAEFEHVPDEETQGDTQALGTATEEQAKALDEDMAMAVDEEEKVAARPEDKDDQVQEDHQDVDMGDAEPPQEQEHQESKAEGQPQAFVGEQKPFSHQEDEDMADAQPAEDDISDTSSVHDVETQLESTHLDPTTLPTPETARNLWLQHESATHSLSQQLTEHLRLILAPTLATKLRGDFRTGKRLNLKRIIPYIASGYKRDKIWLRRSMPSKRNYQVLIALDDSKSMAESGASNLALKTLTLVTRSLSMLEVGEVAVVGFGDEVNVAHDFDKPFTSDAGVRVFEQFGFGASKTNVRGLVERSLGLFEEARRRQTGVGEELWQLMLVVSDGICDSHAEIQRLVRRANEERVMIVFIIVDATTNTSIVSDPDIISGQGQEGQAKQQEKTSILDLQSVEISPEGRVVRWKYMERFPFRYYLVVRDVRELPGVLAGALRQWFGEVAGSV